LDGLKIVVDCANGAAYKMAPAIFWELGADVVSIHDQPNGYNINDKCGATHVADLQDKVVQNNADVGIALDGDADRLIMVDNLGNVVDGDQLLALVATAWTKNGQLKGQAIVATQMSNLGLERYIESLGLKFLRSQVGDRYVIEMMRQSGCNIGGEQSGHLILNDYATTGDGLISAMQILSLLIHSRSTMAELSKTFTPVPQKLVNIKANAALLKDKDIKAEIKACEERLKNNGRLLVRASGTEPLIRVMVESTDSNLMTEICDTLAIKISNYNN
jgi:phosphoglucosamine mutase